MEKATHNAESAAPPMNIPSYDEATKRVRFDLTYRRTERVREWNGDGLDGPWIDNAYPTSERKDAPGSWSVGDGWPDAATRENWLHLFFRVAIDEVVHEALEWFQVDGRPWLDPHDHSIDTKVYDLTKQLADDLFALGSERIAALSRFDG